MDNKSVPDGNSESFWREGFGRVELYNLIEAARHKWHGTSETLAPVGGENRSTSTAFHRSLTNIFVRFETLICC